MNFLQFNPSENNQESDAAYQIDPMRVGGFAFDSEVPSQLLNKLLYQFSTFIAAFGGMMAAKPGAYDCNDINLAALQAVLANIQTAGDSTNGFLAVAYGATVNLDCSANASFQLTLQGNCAVTFVNAPAGKQITLAILQDSTGGHALTMPNTQGYSAFPTDPSSTTIQTFFVLADGSIHVATPAITS